MRIVVLLVVVAGLGVVPASGQAPAAASRLPASIYVSEFVSRSIADKALLASFTDLFETALVKSGPHTVLNRRNLQKVLAEAQSESYVASMRDLSTQARVRIPALEGAEGVIFGEVTDDTDSGDVSITVTLESFDSVIHWKRSISMKRGLLRDLASRRETMEALARTDGAAGTGQGTNRAPTVRLLQPFYAKTANWTLGIGYIRVPMKPSLPRDLINHGNHPDDSAFLNGSPGITDLQKANISAAEVETGLAYRPSLASFALIAEYVLKLDVSSNGRLEHQQINDPRPPVVGSFIYSQLTDVSPAHALRTGAGAAWPLSERRDWWFEAQGLIDVGRWDMTFEKGWSRFGKDQTSLLSKGKGIEASPRVRIALVTGVLAVQASVVFTQIRFTHELPQLEPHTASGVSFGFGGKVMLPR